MSSHEDVCKQPVEQPRAVNHVARCRLTRKVRRRSITRQSAWDRVMRCMVCGEEMRLVETVPDETMPVPGFEHHILNCPSCHDEERRLVFTRQPEASLPTIQPEPSSPPIQTDEIELDFIDATLQPLGETAAADAARQESGGDRPAAAPAIASLPSRSASARTATASVWSRRAALHRARWRALCDRLGLRVAGSKADVSGEK